MPGASRSGITSARTSTSRSIRSGTLDLVLSITDKVKSVKAGEDVSLQPLLYTGDGLLINVAYRGSPASPRRRKTWGR